MSIPTTSYMLQEESLDKWDSATTPIQALFGFYRQPIEEPIHIKSVSQIRRSNCPHIHPLL